MYQNILSFALRFTKYIHLLQPSLCLPPAQSCSISPAKPIYILPPTDQSQTRYAPYHNHIQQLNHILLCPLHHWMSYTGVQWNLCLKTCGKRPPFIKHPFSRNMDLHFYTLIKDHLLYKTTFYVHMGQSYSVMGLV